mmetsp:Transcript_33652/g.29445  ORF Transcript_33652/g.29445 Transcript_33652/m.29445 type:complete len:1059 (-) Transcript_33652:208-3384(-)
MSSSIKHRKLAKEKSHKLHDSVSYVDKAGAIPESQREKYIEFVIDLADNNREETKSFTHSKQWLDFVLKLRKKHKIHPRKAQIKKLYQECLKDGTILEQNLNLEQYLTIKQSRSLSGVLVIAVLMSPYPVYLDKKTGKVKQQRFSCAHNCYYCPNEPGMPRSYLSKEAAVSRAIRSDFDAIDQFYSRANTLKKLGHDVDKIELLVLGGTFCQFPQEYQEQFIRDLFWSANTFYDGIDDYKKKRPRKSLSEEIKIHETATKCRIVGLTLETRPDTIRDFQTIRRFREYGATRLQIGVQHTDDTILKHINRGCYNSDTITAIRLLKNSGYKIDIHLMPNLPGSNPEKDIAMFDDLLTNEFIQCDQWKVYPCQTVDYSLIQKWYEKGIYKPYSLERLMQVVISLKSQIPPWIRLNRIFRSLPEEHITSGITMSNFRQHMYHKMNEQGKKCKCIRCREIGTHIRREEINLKHSRGNSGNSGNSSSKVELEKRLSRPAVLKKRKYRSSGGDEIFISFESEDEEILMGFVRLRLPPIYIKPEDRTHFGLKQNEAFLNGFTCDNDMTKQNETKYGTESEYAELISTFPELYQAALVREAHVYGAKQNASNQTRSGQSGFGGSSSLTSSTGSRASNESIREANEIRNRQNLTGQSRGYGTSLMTEAEKIAKSKGYSRVAVIAGVGTRLYYRLKLGYKSAGTYMVKDFNECGVGQLARNNVNNLNIARVKSSGAMSLAICVGLYILSAFLSILFSLVVSSIYCGWLNYLHFHKLHHAKSVNRSLLNLSKIALLCIDGAIIFKICSALFPHFGGLTVPQTIINLFDDTYAGNNGDCYCRTYWSLSLVLYVAGFYLLKLIYHKRVIIMVQNPLFGNDSGLKSVPISLANLLLGQIVAFTVCQFLCLNFTNSHCTDESSLEYDLNSSFGCHDQFAPVITGVAVLAILFDAVLFSLFCSKWYAIMLIFMEEMATSLLLQFSLICIAMASCCFDAVVHVYFSYCNRGSSKNYQNFDSFLGTPAFLLDCCIIATCIVISFTETQKYVLQGFGIKSIQKYYQSLENIGYKLHIM